MEVSCEAATDTKTRLLTIHAGSSTPSCRPSQLRRLVLCGAMVVSLPLCPSLCHSVCRFGVRAGRSTSSCRPSQLRHGQNCSTSVLRNVGWCLRCCGCCFAGVSTASALCLPLRRCVFVAVACVLSPKLCNSDETISCSAKASSSPSPALSSPSLSSLINTLTRHTYSRTR